MKQIFTDYFLKNTWGDKESVSGPGSTVEHTLVTRTELTKLFKKYDIKHILDAPCGDYTWFKLVDRDISYIGGDIVEPLIKRNQLLFTNDKTCFMNLDITSDPLPKADLMLCRDCWPHMSDADIKKSIKIFLESEIPYLLTTVCGVSKNVDIETGGFRFLNLFAEPFSFELPLEVIPEWTWPENPPKTLMLFSRAALLKQL